MKVKCEKCIHCVGIFKRNIVCKMNEESLERDCYRPGNYWGMRRPRYCKFYLNLREEEE